MKRETSLYLDLMRVIAALAVYLSHIKRKSISYGLLEPLGQYGQEGVVIFFVISGAVICYAATTKEKALGPYAVARLARLWSVVIPAIILTIILDVIGFRLDPGIYREEDVPIWGLDWNSAWRAFAPTVFLNQVRNSNVAPGSNGPFWSLCYEFWYYAAFGAFLYFRGIKRVLLLAAIAILVSPMIIVLFPIWLLGVYTYKRIIAPGTGNARFYGLGWFISGGALVAVMVLKYKILNLLLHRFGISPQYLNEDTFFVAEKYAVGILFAANLVCFARIASPIAKTLIDRAAPAIQFFSKRTFSLYLYQAPAIFFFGALTMGISSHLLRIATVLAGTLGMIFILASVTELKKRTVAGWLSRLFGQPVARSGQAKLADAH